MADFNSTLCNIMKIFAMEYNVISMRREKNEKNYAKASSSADAVMVSFRK